jgi:flagellin
MALNDISLTSGMRSNLTSLQSTVDLLNRTQTRLSTGKKVNTALDNPTSFFAAQKLTSRASDLSSLKDSMSQAVQTIQAANNGITGINTLIEAAKGIASSALSSSDTSTVFAYGQQYDAILGQINNLATDSGYSGSNLLNGASLSLTVKFDNTSGSSLIVTGGVNGGVALSTANLNLTVASTGGSGWAIAGQTTAPSTANINGSLTALATAQNTLQTASGNLSANLAIVNTRQSFTTNMVNTLTTGSDSLTLADMNEEGANMLMLQTRQSLGTTALSLSAQAAQSVLKLF